MTALASVEAKDTTHKIDSYDLGRYIFRLRGIVFKRLKFLDSLSLKSL
jgi:hypothetical protein